MAWKPGQSGNPGGKPKGTPNLVYSIRELYGAALRQPAVRAQALRVLGRRLRRADIRDLELAAKLAKEIGSGAETVAPAITIIFESNIRPEVVTPPMRELST